MSGRVLACLLAAVLPWAAWAQTAPRPRVVAVKSAALAPYAAVVAGFSAEAQAEVVEVTLTEDSAAAAARVFQRVAAQKPALVLALGPLAANAARRALGDEVPVLFAMVPYYERYGLEGPKVTGIALTSDFRPELAALQALSPEIQRVGILHDGRYSAAQVEAAQAAAKALKMTIIPLDTEGPARTEKVLGSAKGRVDAMLMVADKTVGNASVVRQLIAFATAAKLPLVALTPSQVKEGATLALTPGPVAIGQQAGRLANRIIHEKVDPGALAVAQPEGMELCLNLSAVTRPAGGGRDTLLELLRFASKRDYAVRSYE